MPIKRKILVADIPEMISLHLEILDDLYDVETVSDYHSACNLAGEDTDLILCGVHFDESRMFEFFTAVCRMPKPFVCFRGLQTPIAPAALRVIKLASEVLGSAGFIDFVRLCADLGEIEAVRQARACIEQALHGKPVECD
jgi:hypothetical protein